MRKLVGLAVAAALFIGVTDEPTVRFADVQTSPFTGVFLTRLSNLRVNNEQPFPWDTERTSSGAWDPADPTKVVIPATGWYWVGADITTLGTYYGGTNNANVQIAVVRNWTSGPALDAYVVFERFANNSGAVAQGNSTVSQVFLEAGDVLELILIGPTSSGLLVESNPSDGQPHGFATDTGPGTLSPHFFVTPL